ncbi:MAG TPA: S46 family peptidase [Gammaproteobacteria bacterium]|nr:S46 family peptidase [Gammaproteobacteria bacterium]
MKRCMFAATLVALCLCAAPPLRAEEGMWTFDNLPMKEMQSQYGFTPSQAWLQHVQLAAVRISGGCSGAFVSGDGLMITNRHCVDGCIAQISSPKQDYTSQGFYARSADQEIPCPEMEVDELTDTRDVTAEVQGSIKGQSGERYFTALRNVSGKLEDRCNDGDPQRWSCQVVDLYHGGRYSLYKYRRFQDVRLVFTPENAIANFGGDPDNFNFPRYSLDVALLRAYDRDKPAHPEFLQLAAAAPTDGELVFTAGNPGVTERNRTVAELKSLRDDDLVPSLVYYSELRGVLEQFATEGPLQERMAYANLASVENLIKEEQGHLEALQDQGELEQKAQDEAALRDWVVNDPKRRAEYGDPWSAITVAEQRYHAIALRYRMLEAGWGFESRLFDYARTLVRGEEERDKASGRRLAEFRDSNLPQVEHALFSSVPVSQDYEELMFTWSLTKLRAALGADDPLVKQLMGKVSPAQLARSAVEGTRLDSPAYRRRLWEDSGFMDSSEDPMLRLARIVDKDAREMRKAYEEEVQSEIDAQSELIAQARFARDGTGIYPDANFTLRLSYGQVRGWDEQGRQVAAFTYIGGLYARATGSAPYLLPQSWVLAEPRLDQKTPLDFVTTNDIAGGNSGSPVIDRDGRLVGLVFDGNIHSLGGDFWYDARDNRAVALDMSALLYALRTVYAMNGLAAELSAGHG